MKTPTPINTIWIITREYGALAGAGGVKDVARQLAAALAKSGHQVSVVLPCYGFMDPEALGFAPLATAFDLDMSYPQEERREAVTVWHRQTEAALYLIDSPRFREKNGVYTYTAIDEGHNPSHRHGEGHYDYFAMNCLLQKAALCLMIQLGERPDIIHCHDGHTALLPAMAREMDGFRHYFRATGLVVTIHNAGLGYHQEVHDLPFARAITGLPARVINASLLDGTFDPFLAASAYAVLNTVSENYARELRETEDDRLTGWLGHALLKRGLSLQGVTNGIDPNDFDLANYRALGLASGFQPGESRQGGATRSGKEACKHDLCTAIAELRLAHVQQSGFLTFRPDQPLFTFIGRLSTQKGVDKMIEALKYLLPIDPDFQILILGSGAKEIEESLIAMTHDHRYYGRLCLLRGFDPLLANRVYAAGDFFLIPSRYEPCGLTDFIAQLFGNLPIVHHVGGLVKVVDGKTGFAFQPLNGLVLAEAMQRAMGAYRLSPRTIKAMQQAAVALIHERYTWDQVKDRYLELYHSARAGL
jgi:starch synthase